MAIDHTQLDDVPRRLAAGPFAATRAGNLVIGAPVGFRIALVHDQRVDAVITQNANAYTDGFGPALTPVAQWWADRTAGQLAIDGLLSAEGTRAQWLAGARDPEHIDPSQYL